MMQDQNTDCPIDYRYGPPSPAKYPSFRKAKKKRSAPRKKPYSKKMDPVKGETQPKITTWLIPQARPKRVTFNAVVEVCDTCMNGCLKKKRRKESLVESVEGRHSEFYQLRRDQKSARHAKYLLRKKLYPQTPRYLHVQDTLKRMNFIDLTC